MTSPPFSAPPVPCTGAAPKLAAHDQHSIAAHARNVAVAAGMGPGDALLLALPTAGVFGFSGAMAALAAGAMLVLQPVFDAAAAVSLLERYHITHFYGPDAMLPAVLDAAGGRHPGYLVSPDMQVRCVAPGTGAPRPPGEPGELQFRGYNVLSCYLGNPAATAASMTADGWFRCGDLGQVQPDGAFIYLAGLNDSLRLGGYLVDPQEVEEQLQAHPAVEIAQLAGVWREHQGDVPVAFVRLRPGARADEPELPGFARHRIPPARCRAGCWSWTNSPAPTAARSKKTGCARSPGNS